MSGISGIEIGAQEQLVSNQLENKAGFGFAKGVREAARNGEAAEARFLEDVGKAIASPKIGGLEKQQGVGGVAGSERSGAPSFGKVLKGFVHGVDGKNKEYRSELQKVLTGESNNIHQVKILEQQSKVSFLLMTRMREELVNGYHQLMKMNV